MWAFDSPEGRRERGIPQELRELTLPTTGFPARAAIEDSPSGSFCREMEADRKKNRTGRSGTSNRVPTFGLLNVVGERVSGELNVPELSHVVSTNVPPDDSVALRHCLDLP